MPARSSSQSCGYGAGGWHAATILHYAPTEEGKFYDVELHERSPVNQMPQVAKSVPSEYVRPQRSAVEARPIALSDMKPGMVVEHMLPGDSVPSSLVALAAALRVTEAICEG